MNYFLHTDIQKITFDPNFSDEQKVRKLMNLFDSYVEESNQTEYKFGKEDGYNEGYNFAIVEGIIDVENSKECIQNIMNQCENDSITLKSLYEEFKFQMKIKNII